MMLGLIIYCYAQGIFSSRQIERATHQNISVRYLTGNTHPDHDTVAKFRRENAALIRSAFVQLLRLAQGTGLLRLGAIALDGTKIAAAAAKRQNVTYERLQAEIRELNAKVEGLMERADAADQNDGADEQLPTELAKAQERRAPPATDDGALGKVRPVPRCEAHEGNAHRQDHYSAMELCPQRPFAKRNGKANCFGKPRLLHWSCINF
jgi:outer membrane murein-binding lipoprotein Lpp